MDREAVEIYLELCHPDAVKPAYAKPQDAGMDIYAVQDDNIAAGQTRLIPTGLKIAIPEGYEVQIRPRSGMSLQTPLRVANSPGTIDAGYRDEVGIIMHNTAREGSYQIKKGERIAQMVLQKVPRIEFKQVGSVAEIGGNRGGGFGSSGR